MPNKIEQTPENKEKNNKSVISKYVDKKTLITLLIVYFLFVGLPWLYNNKNELLGRDADFIIKIPLENFGVEPNKILTPYGFDLIPKEKNKVVNIKNAVCTPNWPHSVIPSLPENNGQNQDNKSPPKPDLSSDKDFKPLFPLPLDSPRRLFCPAVKLPDIPGQYSFTILIESDTGEETREVKFYVTKPLGELQ